MKEKSFIIAVALVLSLLPACHGKGGKETTVSKIETPKAVQQLATPTLIAPARQGKTVPPTETPAAAPVQPPVPEGLTPPPPLASTPPATSPESIPAPAIIPPTTAETAAAKPIPFQPKLVAGGTNLDILLDASGSMAAPFGTSTAVKFDIERTALLDIFTPLTEKNEATTNVALRLFGSRKPAAENDCTDTERLYPLGAPDIEKFGKLLGEAKAQGTSPVARALQEAAHDFPAGISGEKTILLVADGADTCSGDPCAVAEELTRATGVIIHVIGFDLSDEERQKVECIATRGNGRFFLARTDNELRAALDEAVNSAAPYNLKLMTTAGALPLPASISVLKSASQQVVRRAESFGTKFLKLDPGSYDILVEFRDSLEPKKPSKIIKGVEILANTKVEQTVAFDLGGIALSAIDDDGKLVATRYRIMKAGSAEAIAQVDGTAEARQIFLTPALYDIVAERPAAGVAGMTLSQTGIEIKNGESVEKTFRFQRGFASLKGATTQGRALPFIFQAFKAGSDQLVASGALPLEGGPIPLAPGNYDILFIGQDPAMPAEPRTKVSGIAITAAQTTEVAAVFEMGLLKLSAVDNEKKGLPAEFVIHDQASGEVLATTSNDGGKPTEIAVPPGTYTIAAKLTRGTLEPRPIVEVPGLVVTADKPAEAVAAFILGTLRLRARDAKEHSILAHFVISLAGQERVIADAPATNDWLVLDLAPGTYDARAENIAAAETPEKEHPVIWLRDLVVAEGKSVSHEAIFTAGKVKIIGRGPNNQIITCRFRIFQYGSDRELISGTTGDDWQVFEIQPGKYYMEAAYHDPEGPQLLKKWINIIVGENEIVEQVLRF